MESINVEPNNESKYPKYVNLLHILVVAPLLIWIGYKLNSNIDVNNIEKLLILLIGLGVIGFHGYKTITKQLNGESISNNYKYQINVLHFLFIGPVVAWVAYKLHNNKTPTDLEKITLLLLGCIAFVYHSLHLYSSI
jgi:uncharacterized membrane protein